MHSISCIDPRGATNESDSRNDGTGDYWLILEALSAMYGRGGWSWWFIGILCGVRGLEGEESRPGKEVQISNV